MRLEQSATYFLSRRQVLMARMSFFIPLGRLSAEFKELIDNCALQTVLFAHHYHTELRIENIGTRYCGDKENALFYYDSQDGHCKPVRRPVTLYPNLVKFKARRPLTYHFNRWLYGAQEARQLQYVNLLDGLLDYRYNDIIISAIHSRELLTKPNRLCKNPTTFQSLSH